MSRDNDADRAALAELGPPFIQRLSALLRTARTYDVSNEAFRRQVREFMTLVAKLHELEDEVSLVAVSDYFYLNGMRIRAGASMLGTCHSLLGEFERRQTGGVRVLPGVTEAEVERFFQIFVAADDPALAAMLGETLVQAAVDHLVVVPAGDVDSEDLEQDLGDKSEIRAERHRARRVFWRAVLGSKKVVLRARQTGRPDLRHAKRIVQPIVDNIMRHEYSIVGMTAIKDHDEYTYAHCVNVAVLSVSIGQVLGLPRQSLADLGVSGLLHDVGKLTIPTNVLRKPAALTPEEWMAMRRHPIEGARMISRMPGMSTVMLDAMRAALEHHMNFNRTGYPEVETRWGQATLSRIVAIADCFDALTAHRAYDRPRTAYEGLQILLGPIRVNFDPAVLWALCRTVGLYPPGTVMQTSSGAVALSVSPNPGDLVRPHCRVLVRPDGTTPAETAPEFWEPMPASETVFRVLLPEEYQVPTTELLAA